MMKEQEAQSNFFVKRIKQHIKANAVVLMERELKETINTQEY